MGEIIREVRVLCTLYRDMPPRFYLSSFDEPMLDEAESHHATQVLRLRVSDLITCFDGKGQEAACMMESVQKKRVSLRLTAIQQTPKPSCPLTLIQAVTKPKSMEWIVQKAVELGVTRIYPVLTRYSIASLSHEKAHEKQAKWRQIAIEACKQCGQNWLPQIDAPISLQHFFKTADACACSDIKLIAVLTSSAGPLHLLLDNQIKRRPALRSIAYAVGPEGDFTADEIELFTQAGFLPVSLGSMTLRSETAALYLAAILRYETERYFATRVKTSSAS